MYTWHAYNSRTQQKKNKQDEKKKKKKNIFDPKTLQHSASK